MVKRVVIGLVVVAGLYLGVLLVVLPVLEHTLGLGVYRKGHDYVRKP